MSGNNSRDRDSSNIDNIIRGLTNRPGVQGALVLSRKDGSIIKATGFLESRNRTNTIPRPDNENKSNANEATEQAGGDLATTPAVADPSGYSPSQAELMADAIHSFVKASTGLAESISQDQGSNQTYSGSNNLNNTQQKREPKDLTAEGSAEADVQLLRMRTRKREVIIFPDPNYLCCVVQNIGKAGT